MNVQPTSISTMTSDESKISIEDYLARPHPISIGSVGTASTLNTTLQTISTGSLFGIPAWQNKLAGIYGFKCTVVFRLETSIQPFQNGILMQSCVPCSGYLPPARVTMCNSRMSLRRQLPSVVHNCSFINTSELRIPYTSPDNFYRFGVSPDWFEYQLSVYSPIGPSGTIPYTIWVHMEDVKLVSAIAQSGISNPADRERVDGILSRPLKAFSIAFHEASRIPLLSSFAQTTSWFLNASSKAASAFGFSNPNSVEHRKAVVHKNTSFANNCDVVDNCDSHGLFISNGIGHLNNFAGNPLDEMSISYIAQIPTWVRTFNWTSANAANSTLTSWACQPSGMFDSYSVATTAPTNVFVVPPSSYLARSAGYWRGSLCYRIHFNKSVYHTGRFAIIFSPGVAATLSNSVPLHKMIVDIRNNYSVDFIVPFLSNKLYLPTTGATVSFGTISIVVLEPLNAPTTVSSTLICTIEFAAGPDFELAAHCGNNDLGPIMAQSGTTQPMINHSRICEGAFNITGASTIPTLSPALFAMGESVTSLRQILKRSQLFYKSSYTIASTTRMFSFFTDPYNVILPNAITGSPFQNVPAGFALDHFSKIAPLFALQRGSMVFRAFAMSASNNHTIISILDDPTGFVSSYTGQAFTGTSTIDSITPNMIYSQTPSQGVMEVHVPYYSSTHSIPTDFQTGKWSANVTLPHSSPHKLFINVVTPDLDDTLKVNVFRQIGEDFSLGAFIGVLPVTTVASTFAYP